MPLDPDDMETAERETYWLEIDTDGYRVMEGESKEESTEVSSDDGWFVGVIQEVDKEAGDYPDSRLYTLRHAEYDKPILLWGKRDLDTKVDNAVLRTGDEIAIRQVGTVTVQGSDGQEREMNEYDVRYDKA